MALAIVAQTIVIGILVTRPAPKSAASVTLESAQAGDVVYINGQPAGHTPMQLNVGTDVTSLKIVTTPGRTNQRRVAAKGATSPLSPPAKTGGVRFVSGIDLKVFEGSEDLGSSVDGPIKLAPGVHQLDLVNTAVGFRDHQTITVTAGQPVTVNVALPEGAITVTAETPASVLLDEKEIGDAPLTSIKAIAGEHEIVLKNAAFGEVRRKVLVRAGETTTVSLKVGTD
jgi:hypothetical protein